MKIHPVLFLALGLLAACATAKPGTPAADNSAPLQLRPASFAALAGWGDDDLRPALTAFGKSCTRILKQDADKSFGPVGGRYGDWQTPCRAVTDGSAAADPRAFFEHNFTPWQVTAAGAPEGLFTGYFEAALRGSRTRHGPYQTALRLRPSDLVMVDLGEFRPELKGQRIAGRVVKGSLKPFEDRAAIEAGKMPNDNAATFVWVDDPADAFFLQVQGSGRIVLDDGTTIRVGYAAQNGHPYYAIGRELVKRGELAKADVSMQSIRAWMAAHPDQADELMNTNKSYVFFEEAKSEGPVGGENVALTPGRSLAVDHTRLPYGVPLWLDVPEPAASLPPLQRLMVAQDTGGAIQGAVRGDVFWGYGADAEQRAGAMKARGRYWLLLPNGVGN